MASKMAAKIDSKILKIVYKISKLLQIGKKVIKTIVWTNLLLFLCVYFLRPG